jgi:hypothetical protein
MTRRPSLAILALGGLAVFVACCEQGPIYGSATEQEMPLLELTPELRERSFSVTMCWEGPVKRPEVYIGAVARQTSGPVGVRWTIAPGSKTNFLLEGASSQGFMGWEENPEDACTDGTTITFSLDSSVSKPVTVEWSVGGSVNSTKDRGAEDLELVLLVEEL